MDVLKSLSSHAASACLGIAFTITVLDMMAQRVNREYDRSGSCLAHVLTGIMLLFSLMFILLANLIV